MQEKATIAQQVGRMNRLLLTQSGHARYSDAMRVVARCNISSNGVDLSGYTPDQRK